MTWVDHNRPLDLLDWKLAGFEVNLPKIRGDPCRALSQAWVGSVSHGGESE